MKEEARVLVSECIPAPRGSLCVGAVFRADSYDGVAVARGCEELCRTLDSRGFMGELRYHYGRCACGLPPSPFYRESWSLFLRAIPSLAPWIRLTVELLGGILEAGGGLQGEPRGEHGPRPSEER